MLSIRKTALEAGMAKQKLASVEPRQKSRTMLETLVRLALVIVCSMSVSQAMAQAVSNAKIHGVVTDNSGAVVPQATITATQVASGQSLSAVSSASGEYVLANLPVGDYVVKVTAPGFQTYSRTGVVLQVSNDLEVDTPLTVGSTDTVVNVEAGASQVQTEDNSINTVVDQARTVDLPLNGRNAANLVLLSGSAAPTVTGHIASSSSYGSIGVNAIGGAVTISVAGGQANQINFLLDGGDNNDPAFNTNLPFPFPDALQEFSVQTTGLAAQYGLHPSGAVNIVTKSGTNQFHGGVFEFLRNNYPNASNRITGQVNNLKRNQYGGFLGGPILHQKLFFFGGYQGTALRISQANTAVIPTTAELAGNWTPYFQAVQNLSATKACPIGTAAAAAKLIAAGFSTADPVGCTATISPSLYSTVGQNVAKFLPTGAVTDAVGDVTYSTPYPQNENQFIGRLDGTISQRQNVFARYFMTNYSAQPVFNGNLLNAINPGLIDRDKTLTMGHNFIINPRLTNSIRLTGNRLAVQRSDATTLPNVVTLGSNMTNTEPNYLYLNVVGAFQAACGPCSPFAIVTNQIQVADDLSRVSGKHFLQFGFDYIDQIYNQKHFNNENGFFTFSGTDTGYSLADLLLGEPTTLTQSNGGPGALLHLRQNYLGYYAQDTYHLTKKLVLNLGIRWEPWFPPYNRDNRGQTFSQANFNAGTVSNVFTNAPAGLLFVGDTGVSNSIVKRTLDNVSPRVGFAFDPTGSGKQSIRGSYTLVFDEPTTDENLEYTNSGVPYGGAVSVAFNNTFKRNLDNPYQGVAGGNPFPSPYPPTSTVAFPSASISPQVDPANAGRPYMNQYNVSYQYQAPAKWLLTASYLGTHTIHLYGLLPYNYATYIPGTSTGVAGSCGALTPVPAAGANCSSTSNTTQRLKLYLQSGGTGAGPRYGAFNQFTSYGMANYNGLILTANHPFANNFTALANYTYSKCLGNINFSGDTSPVPQNPGKLSAEYGHCNFDVTHNFTISGVITTPKLRNHLLNELAGGFQVSPLFAYRSGLPFTVTDGVDVSLTGVGSDRPNVLPGVPVYRHNFFPSTTSKYPQWYNPAAFALAAPGNFGNEQLMSLRGPGYANLDLAISKFIPIYERAKLELRGEAFNALNHPNYSTPTNSTAIAPQLSPLNSATAGLITSTATDNRILQIAAKITF
jgi:hypothetical protein